PNVTFQLAGTPISATDVNVANPITAVDAQTAVTPLTNTERQRIVFTGGRTGGTFRLTYGTTGLQSALITYSPTLATLQNNVQVALDAMFGAGNTIATARSATEVTIDFVRDLSNANIAQLGTINTLAPATAAATGSTVFDGTGNAVQSLYLTPGNAGGGSFTLSFNGVTATNSLLFSQGAIPSPT